LVWSLKEAWYKARNHGEPFAPRGLDVCPLLPVDPRILNRLTGEWTDGSITWTHNGRWISVCRRGRALATLVVARLARPVRAVPLRRFDKSFNRIGLIESNWRDCLRELNA
jgi:hypothetical protein